MIRQFLPGLLQALWFAVVVAILSGCALALRSESWQPVHCAAPEVFAQGSATTCSLSQIGLLPFAAPPYANEAEQIVGSIYHDQLLGSGAFRKVVAIPRLVNSDEEAIWWGRRQNCELVMTSRILYLLYGAGGLPTCLEVSVRILDTRTGALLWDLRQKAYSNPGPDLDFFWTTVVGNPARGYPALAKALARQCSQLLVSAAAPVCGRGQNSLMLVPQQAEGISE